MAAVSEYARSTLAAHYQLSEEAIAVIRPAVANIFRPVPWEGKEGIKEQYADSKAYFLCPGDSRQINLINLLKAFTLFKKRQKSNMLLLITGMVDDVFKKELSSYTFRNEVVLLENLSRSELASVIAAAYALVYPVLYTDLAIPVLQAVQSGIPAIVSNNGSLRSICGNAALYVDFQNIANIAENMMLVFKDESLAKSLTDEGKLLIKEHQGEKSAELLMQCIQKAVDS
ncbi:MAG: glycosyltransferase [Chitinophagaceae bacterium]|nr:glycosyltransferase [Chitinophagaceae bacterium]